MKALLICPNDRQLAAFYALPLALVPLLGRTALDRALADLVRKGIHDVRILATDRPELIRDFVAEGKPWGISAEVIPIPDGITIEQIKLRYGRAWANNPNEKAEDILIAGMDYWPGETVRELWHHPGQWLDLVLSHVPECGRRSIGMREVSPEVWLSTRARVSSRAKLIAPCWIGHNAWIGSHATIGPRAIIESDACVDEGAEVVDSHVGPATYVGGLTEVRNSLAWGNRLLNHQNGSIVEVSDPFLLADLGQKIKAQSNSTFIGRSLALFTMLATSPIAVYACLRASADDLPLVITHRGVKAPMPQRLSFNRALVWYEFNGVKGPLRRWPQLWNIVRGDMAWVGNRPLTNAQASELVSDYEHLWLHVAPGLISMADAEGCEEPFDDVAKAHAAFYTVHASRRLDFSIILRVLKRFIQITIFPQPAPTEYQPLLDP